MIPTGPLFHKPKSIIAARNILYASLFLSVISLALIHVVLNSTAPVNIRTLVFNGTLIILFYIAIRIIGFGKKWARNLFLVIFIIYVIASPIYASLIFRTNLVLGFLFVLQMLLQILALFYLFNKSSTAWFNNFNRQRPQ